ncbi:MBL fold metallo-hydrolase [Sphingomonas sp. RB56-2]|uniref:MBL fold metallo-hydrolase n=1 Tax=Sphingomonas brevis TaxID=2908206 RepID=A0ABT0SCE5_9SPHN|nr:MBL fold metallo-hydrolase [Sphingomonas brevis]MCL6742018.1 MBL fold metallo-hydrolase [Sphingomonas brevis]
MQRSILLVVAAAGLLTGAAAPKVKLVEPSYTLIPGSVPLDKGPDGNSIFLDAPQGLIVVDTGRHPEHAELLLAYAKQRGKPIAVIVNTHWHLDHTTGNYDIRTAYPRAQVYATTAIEGALKSFLQRGREQTDKRLADPKTPADVKAQLIRARHRLDNPDTLRPTVPVTKSAIMKIAGRKLDVHVAPYAATEADLWLYVPDEGLAIVGDLVVDIVPFMDTACAEGWQKALGEVAATPFTRLIPGHGAPMNRDQFNQWRKAFDNFIDCGQSIRLKEECVAGWKRDAAPFIDAEHGDYVTEAAGYYLDTRLRSSPEERQKYCKPGGV